MQQHEDRVLRRAGVATELRCEPLQCLQWLLDQLHELGHRAQVEVRRVQQVEQHRRQRVLCIDLVVVAAERAPQVLRDVRELAVCLVPAVPALVHAEPLLDEDVEVRVALQADRRARELGPAHEGTRALGQVVRRRLRACMLHRLPELLLDGQHRVHHCARERREVAVVVLWLFLWSIL